jgi:chromosome segregation ATPase
MNLNSLAEKKTKLEAEVSSLERRLQELTAETESVQAKLNGARGGLAVLTELVAEQISLPSRRATDTLLQIPAIKLRDTIERATTALRKFSREDLEQWIRSNYPQVQFSKKSIDGPLRGLMAAGKVVVLRRNTGNKIPAIYGLKEQAEGANKQPNK